MVMARAPKLLVLFCTTIVALVLLVNRGNGTIRVSRRSDEVRMASSHLEDAYVLYFQQIESEETTDPGSIVDYLQQLTEDYSVMIKNELDGVILHIYDTLLHGLAFQLEYTEKVNKALGIEKVSSSRENSIEDHLLQYLGLFRAEDMIRRGVSLTLERDKTMSIVEHK